MDRKKGIDSYRNFVELVKVDTGRDAGVEELLVGDLLGDVDLAGGAILVLDDPGLGLFLAFGHLVALFTAAAAFLGLLAVLGDVTLLAAVPALVGDVALGGLVIGGLALEAGLRGVVVLGAIGLAVTGLAAFEASVPAASALAAVSTRALAESAAPLVRHFEDRKRLIRCIKIMYGRDVQCVVLLHFQKRMWKR